MPALPFFCRELRLLAHLPLDVGDATVQVRLETVLDGIGGTGCGFSGTVRRPFLLGGRRRRLRRRIEQRRLTGLNHLGAVAPAAGLAARLGDAHFLRREAEQVVKGHYRRLYFGFLLSCRCGRACRFCPRGILRCGSQPCILRSQGRFRRPYLRRLLLFQPCVPNAAGVEAHDQTCVQVPVEQPAQAVRDAFRAALVPIDHCGLAVGVGVQLRARADDLFLVLDEIAVGAYAAQRPRSGKQPFIFGQPLFAGVFLQDDKVAAHLRPGIVGKEVVRQTDSGNQTCLFHHFEPYRFVLRGVQHALRGDERHDTAVADGIQPFEEKVVVYGLRRHAACGSLACGEGRIEDGHVAERDIGNRRVEIAVERFLDALEPLRPYLLVGIEAGEDFTRQEVFLEGHDIDGGVLPRERPDERSVPCRGFQQAERTHIIVVQHVGQSLRYRRRGIERRQHGAFQTVDITLVFVLAGAVLTDQTVQLHRLREQVEVGFRPLDGIGQRGGGIEDTFQSPETAVAGEPLPLLGSGRPSCLAQLESRPYRLDVVAQLGFTVKGHSLPTRLG